MKLILEKWKKKMKNFISLADVVGIISWKKRIWLLKELQFLVRIVRW